MQHIALLTIVLSTLVGTAAIGRFFSIYTIFRQKYLLNFGYFLLFVLLANITNFTSNYLFANEVLTGELWSNLSNIAELLFTLIGIYNLILAIRKLLNQGLKVIWYAFNTVTILLAVASIYNSLSPLTTWPIVPDLILLLLRISLYAVYLATAAAIVQQSLSEKNKRRLALIFTALFVGLRPTVDLILNLLINTSTLPYYTFLTLQYSVELITYLLILRYIKDLALIFNDSTRFNELDIEKLNTFNISEREREVIAKIVAGLSNQEISEELHISILTVKDHVYKIYKKCNVSNRVQLSNLFRKS